MPENFGYPDDKHERNTLDSERLEGCLIEEAAENLGQAARRKGEGWHAAHKWVPRLR